MIYEEYGTINNNYNNKTSYQKSYLYNINIKGVYYGKNEIRCEADY